MKVITFITDFGNRENFVGIIKGVIYSINPDVKIVDITNEVSPHNIREASFYLLSSYRYFPKGSIHLVIVDPGVGSERKAIACRDKNYIFIAPDNGLLTPIIENIEEAVILNKEDFFLHPLSKTFHARDIFAPVAGYLSKGIKLNKIGERILPEKLKTFYLNKPEYRKDRIKGEIFHIDNFGNIITNFAISEVLKWKGSEKIKAILNGKEIRKWTNSYEEGGDEPFLIEGSAGFIEIALRRKSASKRFGAKLGDKIILLKV